MKMEYSKEVVYDIDLNKISKSLYSLESINVNSYINEIKSVEAITMSQKEFEEKNNDIKEILGKMYDETIKTIDKNFELNAKKLAEKKIF